MSKLREANLALQSKNYALAFDIYNEILTTGSDLSKNIATLNLNYISKKNKELFSAEKNLDSLDVENLISEQDFIFENPSEQEVQEWEAISTAKLNWVKYFEINKHNPRSKDPIIDYIRSWSEHRPLVDGYFDTSYYLDSYKDISLAKINPLLHYISHGQKEGRLAKFKESNISLGALLYNPELETVVFVSHESSATGAPLLGCNIATELSRNYNIAHIVLKEKEIGNAFIESCFLICRKIDGDPVTDMSYFMGKINAKTKIKAVIINSVVGHMAIHAAKKHNLPVVLLIHEFPEYIWPFLIIEEILTKAHIVVAPAQIIVNSMMDTLKRSRGYSEKLSNIRITNQGRLPKIMGSYGEDLSPTEIKSRLKISSQDKVIVGSGYVQIRKGVDLFLLVARYVKKYYKGKYKFIWVGDGYDPDNELSYCAYLKHEIKNSGLEDNFQFLQHQKSLDAIFSIADVFCLPARLDPFPNVILDALHHDLHVACFKNGTGCAEFLESNMANATVVDLLDVDEMAKGIGMYLQSGNKKKNVNSDLAENKLKFSDYVTNLTDYINQASISNFNINKMAIELYRSKAFDFEYNSFGMQDEYQACLKYVNLSVNGFYDLNPIPGFSTSKWLNDNSDLKVQGIVPLYEAMKRKSITTHSVEIMSDEVAIEGDIKFKYAIHLHVYYLDLIELWAKYFRSLPGDFDLYISVSSEIDLDYISDCFATVGAGKINVIKINNFGRNIYPFCKIYEDFIVNGCYEVVGHFHTKKSLNGITVDGDKWIQFLMDTLIGNSVHSKAVLSLFECTELGILFPEEVHSLNIGENREYVNKICHQIEIEPPEQTPIYPAGFMFWARVNSIQKITNILLDEKELIEPLPYDGTILHAFERVIPFIVESSGHSVKTIYRRGFSRR